MNPEKWSGFTDEDIKIFRTKNKEESNAVEVASTLEDTERTLNREGNAVKSMLGTQSECTKKEKTLNDLSQNVKKDNVLLAEGDDSYDSDDSSELLKKNGQNECCSNNNLQELKIFETRQKRIEAENARRRALINKAISEKKMQTEAESVKLAKITGELKKLDSILSADVSILRNYIEKASFEFSEAEKRYLKAEREFIEAKLYLYEKMQRKEQLTEHLCTIIEQNENRKANKLVELMRQLEMEAIIEDCDTKESDLIFSKLCILNDEPYNCCQTLRPLQNINSKSSEQLQNVQDHISQELT